MARIRTIKPRFFQNEYLADCGPHAMLLFAGLWCQADREGRLEDRPRRLQAEIFPYWHDLDVDALLTTLATAGFIQRYRSNGAAYIAIPTWKRHQVPHIREAASTLPAPPSDGLSTHPAPVEHSANTVLSTHPAPVEHSAEHPPSTPGTDSGIWNLESGPGELSRGMDPEGVQGEPATAPSTAENRPKRRVAGVATTTTTTTTTTSLRSGGADNGTTSPPAPTAVAAVADVVATADKADESPAAAAVAGVPAPGVRVHPFNDLWTAFDTLFGEARARTEKSRRAAACKDASEGHYTGEDVLRASAAWCNVMGDATMTEHGIVANLSRLLHGPQVNGRTSGVVQAHTQRLTESAVVLRDEDPSAWRQRAAQRDAATAAAAALALEKSRATGPPPGSLAGRDRPNTGLLAGLLGSETTLPPPPREEISSHARH